MCGCFSCWLLIHSWLNHCASKICTSTIKSAISFIVNNGKNSLAAHVMERYLQLYNYGSRTQSQPAVTAEPGWHWWLFYLTTDRFSVSPCSNPVAVMCVPKGAPLHSLRAKPSSTSLKLITQLWRTIGKIPKTYQCPANVNKPLTLRVLFPFSIPWQ